MTLHKQVAVIAPEQLIGAFAVLIQSASSLTLLAAATSLEALWAQLVDHPPDVILLYLVHENDESHENSAYAELERLKAAWPDMLSIAVVKYAPQQEKALEAGAHVALIEGVSARRLLAAIEGKVT